MYLTFCFITHNELPNHTFRYQNNHVSPSEIESVLQKHPDVMECLVFGKKDPKVQELISAVIVLSEKSKVMVFSMKN